MNRRNFLSLGISAVAVATVIPSNLSAVDFRATKPKAWDATTTKEAIKSLYGTSNTTPSGVKLKAPEIAENGAVIPLTISSKMKDVKTVSLFQDANPESAVAVFTVPDNGIVEYSVRIKMQKTGNVTAIVATKDGKLYSAAKLVKVTKGGCGG